MNTEKQVNSQNRNENKRMHLHGEYATLITTMGKAVIYNGDSLEVMKGFETNSVDTVITDPPYGYSFMGKDWDKAVPSTDLWRECFRIMKPGAFMAVMSAPRSDVQAEMISRIRRAGFRIDFTPIYWTYASGFPKAGNIGKLVDKRLGKEGEWYEHPQYANRNGSGVDSVFGQTNGRSGKRHLYKVESDAAKALDGSYAGFQPKPAVEVIIVAMKPLSEKTYVDQALKNGKGITWLDDGRIPAEPELDDHWDKRWAKAGFGNSPNDYGDGVLTDFSYRKKGSGRFPANLLVSDDVLNDGVERKSGQLKPGHKQGAGSFGKIGGDLITGTYGGDSGSYSRYFDLDKWAQTLPFLIVPKASKSEKNKGLEHIAPEPGKDTDRQKDSSALANRLHNKTLRANHHPTVKPLKLMSYLITLFSRPGDVVLDPFVGSGTTAVAAKHLSRVGIGIEREPEYAAIAQARVDAVEPEPIPALPPILEALEQEAA